MRFYIFKQIIVVKMKFSMNHMDTTLNAMKYNITKVLSFLSMISFFRLKVMKYGVMTMIQNLSHHLLRKIL